MSEPSSSPRIIPMDEPCPTLFTLDGARDHPEAYLRVALTMPDPDPREENSPYVRGGDLALDMPLMRSCVPLPPGTPTCLVFAVNDGHWTDQEATHHASECASCREDALAASRFQAALLSPWRERVRAADALLLCMAHASDDQRRTLAALVD